MIARVANSEAALLTVARAMVGQVSPDAAAMVLRRGHEITELRPTAMRLLKETLARGAVLELARRGGWRRSRHLRDGAPSSGRLWERHAPPTLRFSAASFDLCQWLAEAPLGTARLPPLSLSGALTTADELMFLLGADLLVRTGLHQVLTRTRMLWKGRLVQLAFFPFVTELPEAPSFDRLMTGDGALVLEAVQADLARQWMNADRMRRRYRQCDAIRTHAAAMDTVAAPFLASCEAAGRNDLADFFIEAGGQLLGKPVRATEWLGPLDTAASLNDRSAARKASGAFLRQLATLHRWAVSARHTAFFDDGYQAAQAFAARWELIGHTGWARAEEILRDLDAIDFESRFAS